MRQAAILQIYFKTCVNNLTEFFYIFISEGDDNEDTEAEENVDVATENENETYTDNESETNTDNESANYTDIESETDVDDSLYDEMEKSVLKSEDGDMSAEYLDSDSDRSEKED